MTDAAPVARDRTLGRVRFQAGLLRLMAFAAGIGAGGTLFAATLHAVRSQAAIGPGYLAGAQALGVALGAAGVLCSPWLRRSRIAGSMTAMAAALACLLIAATLESSFIVLAGMFLVGVGVGAAVSRIEGCVAQSADPARPTSSVLAVSFFGALGAMAAPMLVEICRVSGVSGYWAPSVSFGLVALSWWWISRSRSSASITSTGWRDLPTRGARLLLFLSFLFGVVDNGVLALAPADYFSRGAPEWVSVLIGVAAAGGVAIAQILSVRSLESNAGSAVRAGLCLALVGMALCLGLLAIGTDPIAGAALVLFTGGYAEIVFGFALFLYLASARGAVMAATAAFVAACGLGEFVGPLVMQGLADLGAPAAGYWLVALAAGAAAAGYAPHWPSLKVRNV